MKDEHSLIPYEPGSLTGSPILVVAPHPDDELFGCSGAVLRAAAGGARVTTVILTDGGAQGSGAARRRESEEAAEILGFPPPVFWGFDDRALDPDDDRLRGRLKELLSDVGPVTILTPSPVEIHPDHRATAIAVHRTLAEDPSRWEGAEIVCYEVSAPLAPNLLVDVTPVWDRIRAAGEAFVSQEGYRPYADVLEGLRSFRRLTLPFEVEKAEAFRVTPVPIAIEMGELSWASRHGSVEGLVAGPWEVVRPGNLRSGRLRDRLGRVARRLRLG